MSRWCCLPEPGNDLLAGSSPSASQKGGRLRPCSQEIPLARVTSERGTIAM